MHNPAVILVFHGSRNPQAEAEAAAFAATIRSRLPDRHVSHGFLRECAPDLRSSIADAVNAGAASIRLIPIFGLTGNHIAVDIPDIIREAAAAHPGRSFTLDPVLVQTPRFVEYMTSRINEA